MKIDYQNNTYEDLLDFKAQGKAWPIIRKAADAGVFQLIHENAAYYADCHKYCDQYWLEKEPGVKASFIKGWCQRHCIEN